MFKAEAENAAESLIEGGAHESTASDHDVQCPICNKLFPSTQIDQHVEQCLCQASRDRPRAYMETERGASAAAPLPASAVPCADGTGSLALHGQNFGLRHSQSFDGSTTVEYGDTTCVP